jgi:membrane-associated phospholipid phosphatase
MQKFQRSEKMSAKRLFVLSFLMLAGAIISYIFIDKSAAFFFYGLRETLEPIFEPITHLGDSKYYIVGLLLVFFFFKIKGAALFAAQSIFVWFSVALSGVVADILKFILGRARPKLLFENGNYGFEFFKTSHEWVSCPSGHASTAISLGVSLAFLFPRARLPILALAVIVAFSRVFITAHFVSDVLIGSLIGALTAVLLERYFANHRCFNIYQNGCTLEPTEKQGKN